MYQRSPKLHYRDCKAALFCGALLGGLAFSGSAHALLNAGIELGAVKRTADAPDNLKLGFGYGAHAELSLLPALNIGVYYLRSTNSMADASLGNSADATFNTLGLRARLILPLPGDTKPYAFMGFGSTWTKYSAAGVDTSGHSWEIPIGLGVLHKLNDIFQISLEAAYRPSTKFTGDAYEKVNMSHPSSGWSALVGFALDL
jgi:hypothetical protein